MGLVRGLAGWLVDWLVSTARDCGLVGEARNCGLLALVAAADGGIDSWSGLNPTRLYLYSSMKYE